MRTPISWDQVWLRMAKIIALRSKDPNTQVGCVIANGPDMLSVGYNGMVQGIHEDDDMWSRPRKYSLVIHAELNAVVRAKVPISGATAYVTLQPCLQCCKAMAAAGISRVLFLETRDTPDAEDFVVTSGLELVHASIEEISE